MASSDRQSLLPSFLYSTSKLTYSHSAATGNSSSPPLKASAGNGNFMIPSPSEPPLGKIEMYSPQFYAACTAGGILSCGLTHMAVTPLDLVKCNMQVSDLIPFYIFFLDSVMLILLFFDCICTIHFWYYT